VTRKTNVEGTHGEGHGWAVSYADLLMVLLSFFVMYFSFAEENPNTVDNQLRRIALSMKGLSEEQIKSKLTAKDRAEMSSLADAMKLAGVKVTQKEDHLLLELQQEFKSGDYHLSKELDAQMDAVLKALVPFHNKVDIMIIGHADQRTMVPRNEFLQDNFDLSSIRALRALKYAIHKGFPERFASARAASYFDRDARSLSVEVRLTNKPGGST
jgi:flagellar motor protein MotB